MKAKNTPFLLSIKMLNSTDDEVRILMMMIPSEQSITDVTSPHVFSRSAWKNRD